MQAFIINGPMRLAGTIRISGSKNAALPILAAALLTDEPITLHDVPPLRDITNMRALLTELGCESATQPDGSLTLTPSSTSNSHARYDIVRTMRASVCVLGPLLARRGEARVAMPGGCAIGTRPIDLHLQGLTALGAEISLEGGDVVARAQRLKGTTVFLGGPFGSTVLGTANVMSAATLAEGVTVIESAACEPEIVDLAAVLNAMGAHIRGAGTPRITIEGVSSLHGAEHRILPDRIQAGTYMLASAITAGDVRLDNCPLDSLLAVEDRFQAAGFTINRLDDTQPAGRCSITIHTGGERAGPIRLTTQPFPGYPTDLQAQMMALLTLARGNSVVTEKIFPERFLHVPELGRMGAQVFRQGPTVVISGVDRLVGAPVMASDLRASASLVLAGLAAEGKTTISRIYHLDRGYDRMDERLRALGASIQRVEEDDL
ncbi:MAG: UDP-N-acetylglucosamine 1-carboxyvinyltransferase [Phycisphaerales bacterium]|nr:UDP-N-acetylglucosamine 1-carboxyvinyltransferase [Phycisphaerales bacterium]